MQIAMFLEGDRPVVFTSKGSVDEARRLLSNPGNHQIE
jgi:hypothetical protein